MGRAIVVLILILLIIIPAQAQDMDFVISIAGTDANFKADSYTRIGTDVSRIMFDQHARTYNANTLSFDSSGLLSDTLDIATNMTSIRSLSPISGASFIENIGSSSHPKSINCSSCSSGIYADSGITDISISTLASASPITLTHGYTIETQSDWNGETKVGFIRHTENATSSNIYAIRGREAAIVGLVECSSPPAGPVADNKPAPCPFGSTGAGIYPIFNGEAENKTTIAAAQKARQEYVMGRI